METVEIVLGEVLRECVKIALLWDWLVEVAKASPSGLSASVDSVFENVHHCCLPVYGLKTSPLRRLF